MGFQKILKELVGLAKTACDAAPIGLRKTLEAYDPVLLNHWLWWRLKCFECSGAEFQRLFEDVVKRVDPSFIRIRPHGPLGDKKCDGLYYDAGIVFQVYSPDTFRLSELKKKIKADFVGAKKHWKSLLKHWVFVYNGRRALPADVPLQLGKLQSRSKPVLIHLVDHDALWDLARRLPPQKRCEILGPPVGFSPSAFIGPSSANVLKRRFAKAWLVLLQDALSPIDVIGVGDALQPEKCIGAPARLSAAPARKSEWALARQTQESLVKDLLDRSRSLRPRFAVFSLAPIPLAIHLGFLLSDRVRVRPFRFDREKGVWGWCEGEPSKHDLQVDVSGLPNRGSKKRVNVVVRVGLSAPIRREDTVIHAKAPAIEIDITVPNPSVYWLRSERQVANVVKAYTRVLACVRSRLPNCTRLHLFCAVPTPIAVGVGQATNPRMNPPVTLYEYSRNGNPRYRPVITLEEK